MRIGFLSTAGLAEGRPDGSAWYRVLCVARELNRNGHFAGVAGAYTHLPSGEMVLRDPIRGAGLEGLDVIVHQRWFDDDAAAVIRRARAYGQTVVADADDWFLGLDARNEAFHATSAAQLAGHRKALAASDGVIASTPALAERVRKLNPNVACVRNAIDLERWDAVVKETADSLLNERQVSRNLYKPTVGWPGNPRFRTGDLQTLNGVIGPFLERHGLNFIHLGLSPANVRDFGAVGDLVTDEAPAIRAAVQAVASGYVPPGEDVAPLLGIPPERVTRLPGAPITAYPAALVGAGIDIGVVPMSAASFTAQKSCLKGMEMAAAGIPFVASDHAEYRWLASQGVGMVAGSPLEWRRNLTQLLGPDSRQTDADLNRERLQALSITERWRDWVVAIENLQ